MYTYINSLEDLSLLNQELLEKPYLGVDTEFRRTTKDNMRLALLQVNDGEEIYLIDPIFIDNPEGNCDFLFSDSVVKIFHSCKEDIEAIYSWTGKKLRNIFDTQLAEAFLGGDYSIGYQGLVLDKLGVRLDKGETRSNWIRRPLTDAQLKYAASDVDYLTYLYFEQKELLNATNKIDWLSQELESLLLSVFASSPLDIDTVIGLSKSEETKLLNKFNEIVIHIAEIEVINSTLFFSKKSQKDFLRLALNTGPYEACLTLTEWRRELILDSLKSLLKGY